MAKIINGSVWLAHMQMALETKANILNTGAVEINRVDVTSQGGLTWTRPYQDALDTIANPAGYMATTALTPTTLGDQKEILLVCNEWDGYFGVDYNTLARGSNDTVTASLQQIANVATNSLQDWLVATAKGAFGTAGALSTTHIYDGSSIGDGYISAQTMIKGVQDIYGESMQDMNVMVVNSLVYTDMLLLGLVEYKDAGTFGQNILATGSIPTVLGMRIVVNDTMCAKIGDYYPSYILKGQPFYLGYTQTLTLEEGRDALTGGGKDYVTWKHSFVPGLKYLSFTGTVPTPTTAVAKTDLSTPDNWTALTVPANQIGIMQIQTSGGRA